MLPPVLAFFGHLAWPGKLSPVLSTSRKTQLFKHAPPDPLRRTFGVVALHRAWGATSRLAEMLGFVQPEISSHVQVSRTAGKGASAVM